MNRDPASTYGNLSLSPPSVIKGGGLLGGGICVCVSMAFAILSPACDHWFMIPVTLCALLLVPDVADWLAQRIDLYDPIGIVGVFGLHFFFLAPILHVHWDSWIGNVNAPPDWRPWLGYMALLNLVGLGVYKLILRCMPKSAPPLRTRWTLNGSRFYPLFGLALLVCLGLQALVYARFGGIAGYMAVYDSRAEGGGFGGMGWIFIISESFPILAFMVYAMAARGNARLRQGGVVVLAILVFVALKMIFGGLRGSRSNTVFGLFWVAGIVHFLIRPLNRKWVLSGVFAILAFMYFYGFYKTYGLESLDIIRTSESRVERSEESGRTIGKLLLGDLGRSDIQAFLFYRLTDPANNYRLRWGETYVHWLTLMIPQSLKFNLEGKREAGTEAQYGSFSPDWLSSRIYGLAGEAMLNFGIFSVPLLFAGFGWLVAKTRWFIYAMPSTDARILLAPLLVNLMIALLANDMNNCEFFLVKHGVIPFVLIAVCVRRVPVGIRMAYGA